MSKVSQFVRSVLRDAMRRINNKMNRAISCPWWLPIIAQTSRLSSPHCKQGDRGRKWEEGEQEYVLSSFSEIALYFLSHICHHNTLLTVVSSIQLHPRLPNSAPYLPNLHFILSAELYIVLSKFYLTFHQIILYTWLCYLHSSITIQWW